MMPLWLRFQYHVVVAVIVSVATSAFAAVGDDEFDSFGDAEVDAVAMTPAEAGMIMDDASTEVIDDGDIEDPGAGGIQPTTTPDNLGCAIARSADDGASGSSLTIGLLLAAVVIGTRRRRVLPIGIASLLTASAATAAIPPSTIETALPAAADDSADPSFVDSFFAPEGARRRIAVSYNPFTLHLSRASVNVEVLLASHHVLVLTPFYASTMTNADSDFNLFRGFGGEAGYRFYFGSDGPRGFYIGPSFLFGRYEAYPENGDPSFFSNFGGAIDAGWQTMLFDRVVVGLGGGVQYTVPTQIFPAQELPASVYAIRGLRPRLLLALGVAFDL